MQKFIFCILIVISQNTFSQRYVDGSGTCGGNIPCYLTIQSAVTATTPGEIVNVYPGTYDELITINKSLILTSIAGKGSTTILSSGTGNYQAPVMITSAASNVTLGGSSGHGFTIVGKDNTNNAAGNGQESAAILIGQGAAAMTNITISHNTITANGEAAILTFYSPTDYLNNLSITNNLINGITYVGSPIAGPLFSHFNTPKAPVSLNLGTSGSIFSNNIVRTQSGTSGISNALVRINSTGSTVSNNILEGIISGPSVPLIEVRGTSAIISCNLFTLVNSTDGALLFLNTSGASPYDPGVTSINNAFQPAPASYTGSTFSQDAGGTAANSTYPASGCSALPVKFVSVNARIENKILFVNWQTENEINNDKYEIQTSCNGQSFIPAAYESAKGTGSNIYTRQIPLYNPCVSYIRIKQTDISGIPTYSSIVLVKRQIINIAYIQSNTSGNNMEIFLPDAVKARVSIFTMDGKKVKQVSIFNTYNSISLHQLSAGVYRVVINDGIKILLTGKTLKL